MKIRWGILGISNIAKTRIVPAIKNSSNAVVAAVASRNMNKATQYAQQCEIAEAFGSYGDLLRSASVDAVYISVPTGLHLKWCLEASQAGKPILCEKPLCCNAREMMELQVKLKKNLTLLAEAAMYKYHPLTKRVKELVSQKRIGDVKQIHATFFAPLHDSQNIRLQPALGGGALLDLGYYCVGIMQHLLAEPVDAVEASSQWLIKNDVDLETTGHLTFRSGVGGTFSCGFSRDFMISYSIEGTLGQLTVDEGGMVLWPDVDFRIVIDDLAGRHVEVIERADHYQLMIEDFSEAILQSWPTQFGLSDSLEVLKILDKLRLSSSV